MHPNQAMQTFAAPLAFLEALAARGTTSRLSRICKIWR